MSSFWTYVFAFLVGGGFCVIAQILIDKTKLTPARILVLYVSAGVLLGAIGVYGPLKEIAGCGATLPLTGFGAAIAEGVKKSVAEDGFLGIFKGEFTAAAAGCSAALVFGYLAALVFKGKPKK
ncbi:MAG: stage V sporulation protein AE [Clostridia bacterium]|nr:stage V sporulation protein AE [Clostridia bacterium]MBQ6614296.1 stage V sporulation protein AE [Clostridia bacterium]